MRIELVACIVSWVCLSQMSIGDEAPLRIELTVQESQSPSADSEPRDQEAGTTDPESPEERDATDEARKRAKKQLVLLWSGLAFLSVLCMGGGLLWGVARSGRWLRKRREPIHTNMPDIWFEHPPEPPKRGAP